MTKKPSGIWNTFVHCKKSEVFLFGTYIYEYSNVRRANGGSIVLCVHECFYIFLMASYQQSILGRWGKLADASDDFLIKVQSGSTVKKGYWGCRSMKMGFFVVRNLFCSGNLRRNNGNLETYFSFSNHHIFFHENYVCWENGDNFFF